MAFDFTAASAGIRDASREGMLNKLSEEEQFNAAKIAGIGEAVGYVSTDYSYNMDTVAKKIITEGDARITFIGDSINNPSSSNSMREGYLREWTPDYWQGISAALTAGNAAANGFFITSAQTSTANVNTPGEETNSFSYAQPGHADYAHGEQLKIVSAVNEIGFTDLFLANDHPDGETWSDSWRLLGINPNTTNYQNWIGEEQTVTEVWSNSTGARLRVLLNCPDGQETKIMIRKKGRGTADYTEETVELKGGYNEVEWDYPATNPTSGSGFQNFICWLGKAGDRIQIVDVSFVDTNVEKGLTLSYMGAGGWGAPQHATGNPDFMVAVGGAANGSGYSDKAMSNYLKWLKTDVIFIWLGQNDAEPGNGIAPNYTNNIEAILDRIAGVSSVQQVCLITSYATNNNRDAWDAMAAENQRLAESYKSDKIKVSHLNLMQKIQDTLGDYSTWQGANLIDGIHPQNAGSDLFAGYIWDELGAAATAERDGGPQATYTVTTDDEYKKLMTACGRMKDK